MKQIFSFISIVLLLAAGLPTANGQTLIVNKYDANGNLIGGTGQYYEYNDANQLVKVRQGGKSGPVIGQYFYDYSGQRIKKIENGIMTYYIGKHYEQRVSNAGPMKTKFYYANGERFAQKESTGNVAYYHSDHLGGTNAITDSIGDLIEKTTYFPFGEVREGGNMQYTYTGKEKDRLTDFYYFEARYYNQEFQHFAQADSVAPNYYDPQDLNRYTYVRNNPIKYFDPTGHEFWKPSSWTWLNNLMNTFSSSAKIQKDTPSSIDIGTSQSNSNELESFINTGNAKKESDFAKTDQLINAENSLDKYRTEKRYAQYSNNCKKFLNQVRIDETGTSLPGLCANEKCTVFNHYAQGSIDNVTPGRYIQSYGKIPHTAKVLAVNKINDKIATITVLDANFQSEGIAPGIRIRRDIPFSEFKDYFVYSE